MGYRGCLGIIRLAKKYSNARMQAAAERALLDRRMPLRQPGIDSENLAGGATVAGHAECAIPRHPQHNNIRGAEYFE
jgi:hypothetical protein